MLTQHILYLQPSLEHQAGIFNIVPSAREYVLTGALKMLYTTLRETEQFFLKFGPDTTLHMMYTIYNYGNPYFISYITLTYRTAKEQTTLVRFPKVNLCDCRNKAYVTQYDFIREAF